MVPQPRVSLGWAVALAAAAALAALAVVPALAGGGLGAAVRLGFSAVCHQLPERSPHLAGEPAALCHRCSGILAGLVLGIAAAPALAAGLRQRIARAAQGGWLVAAALPTALDWLLGAAGVWANTPASRVLTGALFGLVAGVVLGANLLAARPRLPTPRLAS